MFNLQGSEIIVILLLALVVLGPEKLPEAIRRFTQTYHELKKMGSGFQSELRSAIDEPMREMRETAEMVRDAADPDRIATAADAERAAATAKAGDPPLVEPDGDPPLVESDVPTDAAESDDPTDAADDPPLVESDDPTDAAGDTAPEPAPGPTGHDAEPAAAPSRVNQIAAANASSAITAGGRAADGEVGETGPTGGGDGVAAADGRVAPTGPAFHSAAPRRMTMVGGESATADGGADTQADDPDTPPADTEADPVERPDEAATA